MMKNVGFILLIIGAVMTIYTGFTFVTSKKVVDLGPLEVNREEDHPVKWSPIVGVVLMAGGIAIIATSKKK